MWVSTAEKLPFSPMRTQKVNIDQLAKAYSHPSTILFRALELKTIYENTKGMDFQHPSLDLGCGDGEIASLLFDEQFTYGVDNGEFKDVKKAIKNKIYGKILLENAEAMSLPDNAVNFVFSNCVLEHIPDNEAVLSETSRILKEGGSFIFTVPSHNFPDYLYMTNKFASMGLGFLSKFYKCKRNKMLNQFHCYSIKDWQKKLKKYGFQIKKFQYYIDKKILMFWDKMALEIFIRRLFNKKIEQQIFNKYYQTLKKIYKKDIKLKNDKGAGLFIHCIKNSPIIK